AEQQANPIPLTTSVAPLIGNQTTSPQLTLTFTAASSYSPIAPPVQNVYYQIDTWQGLWLRASGAAPTFTGGTPMLQLGTHVVYASASDGQTADSIQTGMQSSPALGQITGYVFTVMPSSSSASVALVSSSNPSIVGQPVTFTATVMANSGTPSGNVL